MNEEMKTCWVNHKQKMGMVILPLVIILGVWMVVKVVKDIKAVAYVGKAPTTINSISVAGKGEVIVKPDIAMISFSVTEQNMDVSKAQDTVNKKMADIISTLKTQGIEDKDIKTTGYNITPKYNYPKVSSMYYYPQENGVLVGYEVSQSVEVKMRDLTKAGATVSKLGDLKVTNMSGLSFLVDKQDEIQKDARDLAIKQAREEAKVLAKSLGVNLGDVVGFSENGNYPIYPMYEKSVMNQAVGMGGATADAVLPAGETKITSNVNIVYEIR
jgi:uncharacterized protein YggE